MFKIPSILKGNMMAKKKEKPLENPETVDLKIKEPSEDEKARLLLNNLRGQIEKLAADNRIEIGIWFTRADVERLYRTFEQLPGIVEYKFEAQLRKY